MNVIKKDGTLERYDPNKIVAAVSKSASRVMVELSDEDKKAIVAFVSNELAKTDLTDIPIKTMHNLVERALDTYNSEVAKSYRDYRNYKEEFIHILDEVYVASQAIRYIGDKENANTDSALVATKRSLIYKELNKRLYRNFFMTKDEVEACRDGYIYIHDQSDRLDTMNCFSQDTKFVTVDGVRSFNEFNDGDTVKVISHTGAVRNAVVHSYGIQNLQEVTFANDVDVVTVLVTENHRWILHDGSETTSLEVGDILVDSPLEHDSDTVPWTVIDINSTYRVEEVWCLEVEVDHSFLLEWGIPTGNCCLFDIEKVMTGGFEMGNIWYNEPKTLDTAFDVIGDIILSTASQQYGGFTVPEVDKILSPYAAKSYKKYLAEYDETMADAGIIAINSEKREAYAMKKVQRDMEQGFQGIEMKLNTVGSSRGDYPFITMTFGLSTDVFGKMVSKTFLTVHMNGQGKAGNKKPVLFPKLVYLYDEELNKPGGVNEDVFEVAIKCSSKTMYPDWLSLTGDGYVPEMYKKYGRVISPMGCVVGAAVVTYKIGETLYVESMERMWDRLSKLSDNVGQCTEDDINRVIYTNGLGISVFDTKLNGFTNVNAIIRNFTDDWYDVTIKNGRRLRVTGDHPFETETRGVVHAKGLKDTDIIRINFDQYSEETKNVPDSLAWLLGFMLCDGCYQNYSIFASIAATGEDDIEQMFIHSFEENFHIIPRTVLQERGKKGTYKDIRIYSDGKFRINPLIEYFTNMFGGIQKTHRHVPNEVFSWNTSAKYAFLAGMIDADGYVNDGKKTKYSTIEIGSTNQELALQQMALAQSLGMPAKIYDTHYSNDKSKIRHMVSFFPDEALKEAIVCKKKRDKITRSGDYQFKTKCNVVSVTPVKMLANSYDLTTDSEHFEVSGIYSHNCRAFLSPWYERGGMSPADENDKPVFVGRFNIGKLCAAHIGNNVLKSA